MRLTLDNRHRAVAACVLGFVALGLARGQEPALAPIEFQRIFIPDEDRLEAIDVKAVPFQRAEFERVIAELNSKYRSRVQAADTRIVEARYTARLDHRQLVSGQAEFTIQHAVADGTAAILLSPWGFAAEQLRWKDDPTAVIDAGIDAAGRFLVVADRSGVLAAKWSLRAADEAFQYPLFRLELPPCPSHILELEVPADLRPVCEVALITPLEAAPEDSARRWRIDLGGATQATLSFTPVELPSIRRRVVLATQDNVLRLTSAGLDLEYRFQLDVHHEPVQQFVLEMDPNVRIAAAKLGNDPIRIQLQPADQHHPDLAVLELPRPVQGLAQQVTVIGFSPLTLQESWKLPGLRLQDATWRRGTVTLDVAEPLVLRNLSWTDAALRHLEPLVMPLSGESRRFELFSPRATFTVQLSPPTPRLVATSGTTVTINESTMAAQFVAQLSSQGGDIFELQLRHEPGWIIDSVETVPPNLIDETSLRGKRSTTRDLRLREAIRPDASARLIVKAHRSMPESAVLAGRDFRPVALLDNERHRALVAVLPKAPLQLAITGDGSLERLSALRLAGTERQLVDAPEGCLLYVDSPKSENLRVALRREPPRYQSSITIDVSLEGGEAETTYTVRCEPSGSRIPVLRLRFSEPVPEALTWSLTDERPGTIAARRLDELGLEWELTLQRPRSVPFELQARHIAPLAGRIAVPVLSCPDALLQAGVLRLRTPDGSAFGFEQQGLRAIPWGASEDRLSRELRSVFRYAPAEGAALSIVPHTDVPAATQVWVWSAELTTYLDASGDTEHVALLKIENNGARHLSLTLPTGGTVEQLEVSHDAVSWPAGQSTFQVPLPANQRFPTVRLTYRHGGTPLHVVDSIQPPLPVLDVPCLRWVWNLWLPPGFQARASRDAWISDGEADATWDERVFGYSLFRRGGESWNLFSLDGWRQTWSAWTAPQRAQRSADVFLQVVSKTLSADDAGPNSAVTWGDAVRDYMALPTAERSGELWIDQQALSELGIHADSPLATAQEHLSAEKALLRDNLVLLVIDGQPVLTTMAGPARGIYGACDTVAERVLIPRNMKSAIGQRDRRCVVAAKWLEVRTTTARSWSHVTDAHSRMPLVGWSNLHIDLNPAGPASVRIHSTSFARGLGWAVFFIAAGAGMWHGRRGTLQLLVPIALVIVCILLVPADILGVVRALLGGLATASVLLFLSQASVEGKGASDDSLIVTTNQVPAFSTTMLLCLAGWGVLAGMAPGSLGAQEPAAPASEPPSRSLYRVFDPSTAPGDTPSKYVYVSRDFFDRLTELKSLLDRPPTPTLLSGANYTVVLESNEADSSLRLAQLTAEFDVSVFGTTGQAIELPFQRDEVRVLEAALDGMPLYSQFSEDGTRLLLAVPTGERHHLQLLLRPLAVPRDGQLGIDLAIPAVATAQVQVVAPHIERIHVQAVGGSSAPAENNSVTFALGPVKRLQVRWPAQETAPEPIPEYTIAQTLWLRADTESYVLDARLNVAVTRGQLHELELYADAGLRPLPLIPHQPVSWVEAIESPPNAPQRLRLQLDRTYGPGEMLAVQMSFAAAESLGSAPWPGPWIYPGSGTLGRVTLGINWPAGYLADLGHDLGWVEISGRDFATLWGVQELPMQAFELPRGRSDWTLTLSPPASQLVDQEQCTLIVGRDVAHFTYSAQLEATKAPLLQLQITIPPAARVSNISAVHDDAELVRRWSQDGLQTATLFLQHPVQGELRLQLDGELAVPRRGTLIFPPLSVVGAQTASRRLHIHREPEVLVTLGGQPSPPPSADASSTVLVQSRPVAVFEQAADLATAPALAALEPITLNVAPNPARFSGQLVSRVQYEGSQWWIDSDVKVKVQQGVLDTLRLLMPIEIAQSLEITPAIPFGVQTVPGQADVHLVFVPAAAVTGQLEFHLRSTLQPSAGDTIAAPRIEVLDSNQFEHFLILPKHSGAQAIVWETRGLDAPVDSDTETKYRVGSRMQAIVREVEQSRDESRVNLMDVQVMWQQDNRYAALAILDLQPGILPTCELELPPGGELWHCSVDGIAALTERLDGRAWRVWLGPEQLPQRLEVIFAGEAQRISTPHSAILLAAPTLRGFDVDRTLWTVWTAETAGRSQPLLAHAVASTSEQRAIRVGEIERILQYDQGSVPRHRTDDLQVWRSSWLRRLQSARDQVHELNDASGARDPSSTDTPPVVAASAPFAPDLALNWNQTISADQEPLRFIFDGGAPTLTLLHEDLFRKALRQGASALIALLACGGLYLILSRWHGWRDWLARWPQVTGVVIGIVWWLWLVPSFVGWLVVLLSLLSLLRPAWSTRIAHGLR